MTKIKQKATFLILALLTLLAGCGDEVGDNDRVSYDTSGTSAVAQYEGEWKIGNLNAGKARMEVYTTGFGLVTIPYASILRMARPHRNVECDTDGGYVVPYDNIGYSQHAIYMRLGATHWQTVATVDGKHYAVTISMEQPLGTAGAYPTATYSKVSGVYSLAFPLQKIELGDGSGTPCETVDTDLTVTFTTITKLK